MNTFSEYPYSGKRIVSLGSGRYLNHPHSFRKFKSPKRDWGLHIPYRKYARFVELAKGHSLSWARRFGKSRTLTDSQAFARNYVGRYRYHFKPHPFGFGYEP